MKHLRAQTWLTATVALAAASLTLILASTDEPSARGAIAHRRNLATWLPYWDGDNGLQHVLDHASRFRYVNPFWYRTNGITTFSRNPGAGNPAWIAALHARGIKVVPTVTSGWSPREAANRFNASTTRTEHVNALVRLVRRHGYAGIDLDYETMALGAGTAVDERRVRQGFDLLVQQLCGRLQHLHKRCDVTVMAKTQDADRVEFDYATLGAAATRLRLMVYDMHGPWGSPGPIASTRWTNDVVAYAASLVRPVKLELAVPLYGYDWARTGTHSVQWDRARALRLAHHAKVEYVGGEPSFHYRSHGVRHVVYYENPRSLAPKVAIANSYGIGTLGFWYVGHEAPGDWRVLRRFGAG